MNETRMARNRKVCRARVGRSGKEVLGVADGKSVMLRVAAQQCSSLLRSAWYRRGLACRVLLEFHQHDLFGHNTKAFPAPPVIQILYFSNVLAGFFTAPERAGAACEVRTNPVSLSKRTNSERSGLLIVIPVFGRSRFYEHALRIRKEDRPRVELHPHKSSSERFGGWGARVAVVECSLDRGARGTD